MASLASLNDTVLDEISRKILGRQIPGVTLTVLIATFGIVGNVLVIWTITRNKSLHTRCFSILCHLAAAELINSCNQLSNNVQSIYHFLSDQPASCSQLTCMGRTYLTHATTLCSQFLTLVVACDRFFAIALPVVYRSNVIATLFQLICYASWVIACGFSAIQFTMISTNRRVIVCTPLVAADLRYIHAYNYLQITISIAVLAVSVGTVFFVIRRFRMVKSIRERQSIKRKWDVASCKAICAVIGVYLLTWITTSICHNVLGRLLTAIEYAANCYYCVVFAVTYPATHFVVYLSMSSVFRAAFMGTVHTKKSTSSVVTTTSNSTRL